MTAYSHIKARQENEKSMQKAHNTTVPESNITNIITKINKIEIYIFIVNKMRKISL